jgi:hypothetical protein
MDEARQLLASTAQGASAKTKELLSSWGVAFEGLDVGSADGALTTKRSA